MIEDATMPGAVGSRVDRGVSRQPGALPEPYWADGAVTLYHGNALELLPLLPKADAVVTDPPYGETSLTWDRWPDGWPALAAEVAPQMWCFGSLRMFMERRDDLAGWKMAQDVVWEKHNGSGFDADRFKRVHELAVHFYRGEWAALHKKPQIERRPQVGSNSRSMQPAHKGGIGALPYSVKDTRLVRSVISAASCNGYAVHPTQKPEDIVSPLLQYSVPPGGLVVDPFAGSGTTLAVARKTGRRAIGIEAREDYCRAIASRLAQGDLLAANDSLRRDQQP